MCEPWREQPRYRDVIEHMGLPGSRALLATPALVCDIDLLDENIAAMSTIARTAGVALRPHVKSHKSAYVAARQLAAGACGLSFAKLSEAEAVVDHLPSLGHHDRLSALVTSPLVGTGLSERAWRLSERCDLLVVADSLDGVDELTSKTRGDSPMSVICDIDVGQARTGVTTIESALRVAERVRDSSHLVFRGVQGYAGNLQHVSGRARRREQLARAMGHLGQVITALEDEGHEVTLRTGGGTGSALIDVELGILNELQCGSYIFMDRQYREALGDDPEGRFHQSLTIAATVVSTNHSDHVTLDAGLKAMATEAGPALVLGHESTTTFEFQGDEHGRLNGPPGAFARGDRVSLVPPHCDPTVNLYDVMWMVRNDTVVDVAAVIARGNSQ